MLPNIAFDDIGPERIHCFYDPKSQMRAMVVIDTTRFTLAGGGVRMAQDVSLTEVVRLARAMTLKYAMLEMPCGGAKAGIILDPSDASRADVMGAFLRAIKPLVDSGALHSGRRHGNFGEGTSPGSLEAARRRAVGSEMFEGMPLEAQLTGAGVVVAAKAACEALSRPLRGATVAIEGFGKVGAGAAKFFAREGARVVAISTVRGTLHDPRGLDVDALLALRDQHGDGALALARGERMPREALFQVDAFVLVPGAATGTPIHAGNVDRIAAKLIVPAANIPYGEGALARLATRGIVALPDFVTNAGGVLGSLAGFQGESAAAAFALVDQQVGPGT